MNRIAVVPMLAAWVLICGVLVCGLVAGPAPVAAQTPAPAEGGGVGEDVGEMKSNRGIPYISGGVGEGEREALRAQARDFNLDLTFTGKSGHYISDVDVSIRSEAGRDVLQAVSEGPLFLVKLPPGQYTVTATVSGKAQEKQARVGTSGRTELKFAWDE